MESLHTLLRRQLKKHFGGVEAAPQPILPFLKAVDEAYREFDEHRQMLERALEFSSQELVRTNSELRAVLEGLPDYLFRLDADGHAWDLSQAGPSLAQSPVRILMEASPYDEASGIAHQFQSVVRQVRETRSARSLEYRASDSGSEHFYEARLLPFLEGEILVLVRDVSERKRSEMEFRAVFENANDGIIILDLTGRILEANGVVCRRLGYRREELLQMHVREIDPPEDAALLRDKIANIIQRGAGVFEGVNVRKDGSRVPVEISARVFDYKGSTAILGTTRDISDRKRAEAEAVKREAELERAKAHAEGASRAKSEFLANMSHEIRTPMNGVMGMTELLLGTDLTGDQRECLESVKASADSLLTVINDVLDFSKIEAGRLDLDPVPFNLRESLEDDMRTLALRAHAKGLELILEIQAGMPETVLGDPVRIRQVAINLLGNAIKFTDQGEVALKVGLQSESDEQLCLHFEVRDTGIGIAPEKSKIIFEAFSQADGSTTRKFGGTGLGLTISSRLVAMMQGELWVESEPGKGSRFHFTARVGRVPPDEQFGPSEQPSFDGVRTLIVDDNATNRRILTELATQWKMRPVPAAGGEEALALLRAAREDGNPFSLVLTDVCMPEMDGFEFAARIKACPQLADAAVIMLTSAEHQGDVKQCRELRICEYLTKPVRRAELLAAIGRALGGRTRVDPGIRAVPEISRRLAQEAPRPRAHILLAEDNLVNQRLALRILEKAGHSVVVAGNGLEALRAVEEQSFDLVLMDVQMPQMDGFEATAAIRGRERGGPAHLPIIAMTAHAMTGDRERCLSLGMDGYISKPIRAQDLLDLIWKVGPQFATATLASEQAQP